MSTIARRQILSDNGHICFSKHRFNDLNYSNFLDFDWLSSSGNSCDDEGFDRSSITNSPMANVSTDNVLEGTINEEISSLNIEYAEIEAGEAEGRQASESSNASEFSASFAHWIAHGGTLYY
ncbi:phosphoinositide phosphatase SAC3-like [Zingiber officinale]|nr:phosphoinositide phosphatase SAC3-like [Zingiber officinale]